uniref:T-cell surface glycoprotein CD3 epsilon chain-like n=1 Tax=Semicossyphus pulcher TaxID=241346 RepID=UPI0037E9A24E
MKCQILFPACLLLLWTLAGAQENAKIKVTSVSDGIKLSCDGGTMKSPSGFSVETLQYKDENSGEYSCERNGESTKIYVKFRTCDNCIQLDTGSIVGLVVGDVLATIVIGVAVYIVASQNRTGQKTSNKKSSDRQPLFPSERSNRAPNDDYQPLKPRGGQKDTYDVLTNRR